MPLPLIYLILFSPHLFNFIFHLIAYLDSCRSVLQDRAEDQILGVQVGDVLLSQKNSFCLHLATQTFSHIIVDALDEC
jgi:hypothetical protein